MIFIITGVFSRYANQCVKHILFFQFQLMQLRLNGRLQPPVHLNQFPVGIV